ncbi:MAG: protein kinase [Myxococcales bacterium]|nr:protein kinase [Myxococcales bacterium]
MSDADPPPAPAGQSSPSGPASHRTAALGETLQARPTGRPAMAPPWATATPPRGAASVRPPFLDEALGAEIPGRYEPLGPLGEGGIGVVTRVHDQHVGRVVALKTLKSAAATAEGRLGLTAAEIRFLDEARITGQLEHPGVVPVHEVGRRPDGALYYTMRHVRGRTLAEALDTPALSDRLRLLPRLIALCQTVAFAHARGVIHRDLKPANVMLGDFGETIVLDWGLAKLAGMAPRPQGPAPSALRADETGAGNVLGTPAYMSPEQAQGDPERVDARSDVYSLGVILYELLAGRVPFVADTVSALTARVLSAPLPSPAALEPACPPELAAVALRALARDPADRYPDAAAMVADLVAFEEGGLVSAHRYGLRDWLRRLVRRRSRELVMGLVLLASIGATWWFRGVEAARAAERETEAEARLVAREAEAVIQQVRRGSDATGFDVAAFRLIARRSPVVEYRLVAALGEGSRDVRRLAARALGGMGSAVGVQALVAHLEGERDEGVRVEIIRALGALGDPAAEDAVYRARKAAGPGSRLWLDTAAAYRMIPALGVPPDRLRDADAWVDLGVALTGKGREDEALRAFNAALAIAPSSPRGLLNRGRAYSHRRRYRRALADLDAALAARPDLVSGHVARAHINQRRGDVTWALADLDTALSTGEPPDLEALRARTELFLAVGRAGAARADLDRLLALDPESPHSLAVDGLYWRAVGDLDRAADRLTAAAAADETRAATWLARGRVLRQRGEVDAARADLDRAIALDPELEGALAERADLALRLGDVAAARLDLDRAVAQHPDDALALAERATLLYATRGALVDARHDLLQAVRLAAPSDHVLVGLLRMAVDRRLGMTPQVDELVPRGAMPWHDRLVALLRGTQDVATLVAAERTPEMTCDLALALSLRGAPLPFPVDEQVQATRLSAYPSCVLLR